MTKHKLYLALMTAVCVSLVILTSFSAISIYREGSARKAEKPMAEIYTPEIVAERSAPIAPLFFAGLGLLAAGLVLDAKDENAEKPARDRKLERDLLADRVARPSDVMIAERRAQRQLSWTGRGLFALCMLPVLIYLLDPAHFPEADPEGMFLGLMRVLLPWTAAGLGALAVSSVLREKSCHREAQAARDRLKEERAAGIAADPVPAGPRRKTALPRAVLLAAALVLILAGVLNGSARDVLYKAITICTECVGLG